MPRIAKELSALEVKRLTQPGLHFVGGVPGLALQVTNSQSRCWVLRAAVGGKRREIGLGGFSTSNGVAEARRKALEARARIGEGVDPVQHKRSALAALKASRLAGVTFKKAAEDFIANNEAGWKNKNAAQWTNTLSSYAYPVIGNFQVADITTAHVLEVLKANNFWTTKTETASRVRQRIEKVLAAADATANRERLNPARWEVIGKTLPAKGKVAKVEHHAALPWLRIPDFMVRLKEQPGMGARALEFAILTATRSGEVRGMTWSELDIEQKVWVVSADRMKAGREHRVPLSDAAMTLLDALPMSEHGRRSDAVVFPGTRGYALSDMTLTAVLKRMEVDVTAHGFRSSFRDWAGEATHHPREVIEHALAHQLKDAAEAAYARGDLLSKRRVLMEDWAAWCDKPAGGVLPISAATQRARGA